MHYPVSSALYNWIPYKLPLLNDRPYCYWLYTGNKRYTEPFFDDTISQCKSLPNNSHHFKSISSLDILPVWAAHIDSVPPTAFIFHVSRCGSTLIAQLLGLNEQRIVLAETPFIDQLLRLPWKNSQADKSLLEKAIPAAIQFYGRRRKGDETHLFIKSDSWHLCFYRQLRQLYPTVPFLLLYRSPDEVIQSQRRRRGMQAVQGVIEPEIFGFDKEVISTYSLDEYMAKVLEHYFTVMLDITANDPFSLLLNYNEPILQIMQKIAAFTGTAFHDDELVKMQERSHYHAKYPQQVFDETKITGAIPAYLLPVMDLYNRIEEKRIKL